MSGLSPSQLVKLVKMLQQHPRTGRRWPEFLQALSPAMKIRDPAKLDAQILREFVVSLIEPGSAPARQEPPATDPVTTSPAMADHQFNERLLARFLGWLQRIDKEARKRATSAPPIARARHKSASQLPACPIANGLQQQSQQQQPEPQQQPQQPEQPVDAWHLVHATRAHEKYSHAYSFPSYLPGWARTKRRVVSRPTLAQAPKGVAKVVANGTALPAASPRLLALDCEMVATADGDNSCLVNLSLVDEQGKVVYTTKVQPRHPVIDYRTEITGLVPGDLDGVTTTRSQARRAVKALLLESWKAHKVPTILVGHGLRNDLAALRLDHQPCIDTSYIFSYKSLPGCIPSLRDLHRIVLGSDMAARGAGRHDSAEDAYAAMRLVLHELGRAQRTLPLPAPDTRAQRDELRSLLLHNIPAAVTELRLLSLFAPMLLRGRLAPTPQPCIPGEGELDSDDDESDVDDDSHDKEEINYLVPDMGSPVLASSNGPPITVAPVFDKTPGIRDGRATLLFKHPGEANAAFKALEGKTEKDNLGLPCKRIKLGDGVMVHVRKYAAHNGYKFAQGDVKQTRVEQARPKKQGAVKKEPVQGAEPHNGVTKRHGLKPKYVKPQVEMPRPYTTAAQGKKRRRPSEPA